MERVGEGTWFSIDRKLFSSDIWFASPWKLKIFLYLLGHANHEEGSFMGVELQRGELIRSYRTIAHDCGYKIGYRLKKPAMDTVRRSCEELTKEQRISQRTVHCGTLFKILKYDELQIQCKPRTVQRKQELPFNDRSIPVQDNNVNNINKEKKKKESVEIPEWIEPEIWEDFKEFRIRKKAPLTNRAIKDTISDLVELKEKGHEPNAVIRQSIKRGWAGVFEIKDNKTQTGTDYEKWIKQNS